MIPSDKLSFHAMLDDDQEKSFTYLLNDKEQTATLSTNASWRDGAVATKAFVTSSKYNPSFKEAGDFEKDQAFSCALWVYPFDDLDGSILARMDDKHDYR